MTNSPRQMLADMRLNHQVLALRRRVLEIARGIVAEEHPEYDSVKLEEAACDLADAQVEKVKSTIEPEEIP